MNDGDILSRENWLIFKIYKQPENTPNWKETFDWYHLVLKSSIKPIVESDENIKIVLFGLYGPTQYEPGNPNDYYKMITPPDMPVAYIQLRISVNLDNKERIKLLFAERCEESDTHIWDYEILKGYDVVGDLGNRYAKIDEEDIHYETLLYFIRYWDNGCRYILNIISEDHNWHNNVDVWGIPHLINNSLGGFLRLKPVPVCPVCNSPIYLSTYSSFQEELEFKSNVFPVLIGYCTGCGRMGFTSTNL